MQLEELFFFPSSIGLKLMSPHETCQDGQKEPPAIVNDHLNIKDLHATIKKCYETHEIISYRPISEQNALGLGALGSTRRLYSDPRHHLQVQGHVFGWNALENNFW